MWGRCDLRHHVLWLSMGTGSALHKCHRHIICHGFNISRTMINFHTFRYKNIMKISRGLTKIWNENLKQDAFQLYPQISTVFHQRVALNLCNFIVLFLYAEGKKNTQMMAGYTVHVET